VLDYILQRQDIIVLGEFLFEKRKFIIFKVELFVENLSKFISLVLFHIRFGSGAGPFHNDFLRIQIHNTAFCVTFFSELN